MIRRTPRATLTGTLFPYTPRFRSRVARCLAFRAENREGSESWAGPGGAGPSLRGRSRPIGAGIEATLGPGIACQGNQITGTRSSAIARPPFDSTPYRDGPRVNEMITSPQELGRAAGRERVVTYV